MFRTCIYIVPPKILPFTFGDDPSNSGDSASVQCSVTSGDLPIHVRWLLNGFEINDEQGITTSKVGKRANALNIDNVQGTHAGNYTCEASNLAGTVDFMTALIVNGIFSFVKVLFYIFLFFFLLYPNINLVIPRIVPFAFEDGPLQTGQYASITCLVPEGDLPLKIRWIFNGKLVENDDDINIGNMGKRSSALAIEPVAARHAGNYTCFAQNSAGSAEYTTELKVIGYNRFLFNTVLFYN